MKLAYRPAEAAAALGVSPRTLQRWMRSGRIASRREGGVRLIPAAELARVAGVTPSVEEYQEPKLAVRVSDFTRETFRRWRA